MIKKNKDIFKEIDNYLELYGPRVATSTLKMMIASNLSDLIFEHHMVSMNRINMVVIGTQFVLVCMNLICLLLGIHISTITAAINIVLLLVVCVNNLVHNYTWKQAKERAELIDKLILYLCLNDRKEIIQELEQKYNVKFNESEIEQVVIDDEQNI